jgi:hypothetical protein
MDVPTFDPIKDKKTPSTSGTMCATCGKEPVVVKCGGCGQAYCSEECGKKDFVVGKHSATCKGLTDEQRTVIVGENESIIMVKSFPADPATIETAKMYDFKLDAGTTGGKEVTIRTIIPVPKIPKHYTVGVLCGPSGSGKTTLCKRLTLGEVPTHRWDENRSITSEFCFDQTTNSTMDYNAASKAFVDAGLNSVPTWIRPYNTLSTGERARADVAYLMRNPGMLSHRYVDEFGSTLDVASAEGLAKRFGVYLEHQKDKVRNFVISTNKLEVVQRLRPDWVYFTDIRKLVLKKEMPSPQDITIMTLPEFKLRQKKSTTITGQIVPPPLVSDDMGQLSEERLVKLISLIKCVPTERDWPYMITEREDQGAVELKDVISNAVNAAMSSRAIQLVVCRAANVGGDKTWDLFKRHHYLSEEDISGGRSFVAFFRRVGDPYVEGMYGDPCAFINIATFGAETYAAPFINVYAQNEKKYNGLLDNQHIINLGVKDAKGTTVWHESRIVVLPHYQGLGIALTISEYFGTAALASGGDYKVMSSHPGLMAARSARDHVWFKPPNWDKKQSLTGMKSKGGKGAVVFHSGNRNMYRFFFGAGFTPQEMATAMTNHKDNADKKKQESRKQKEKITKKDKEKHPTSKGSSRKSVEQSYYSPSDDDNDIGSGVDSDDDFVGGEVYCQDAWGSV